MSKINSVSHITSHQAEKKLAHKPNTFKTSKRINYSPVNKIVKRNNLVNSSKSINKNLKNHINTRVKRNNDKLNNNLVKATREGDYNYWLSQEDIADIARLKYCMFQTHTNYDSHFEIIGSFTQLKMIVKEFKERTAAKIATNPGTKGTVLTLIIHQPENHWASLVIFRDLGHITGLYLDSNNQPPSTEYQIFFSKNRMELVDLTRHFIQQQDGCNCGLWALENAADINLMLHKHEDILWASHQISRPRNKLYFDTLRREYAQILFADLDWRNRHPNIYEKDDISPQSSSSSNPSSISSPEDQPAPKRAKIADVFTLTLDDRIEAFSEAFIASFGQRLAACHVMARVGKISQGDLQTELVTGVTGALLGAAVSQCIVGNCMGVIPSLVASTRAISSKLLITGKLLIKRKTASRITKYFEKVKDEQLGPILKKAAFNIFCSYEYQFIHISDQAGAIVAMEKLADDAVDRIMNFLKQQDPNGLIMSNELLEKGVLQGRSKTFFDPSLKLLQVRIQGKTLINDKFESLQSELPISSSKLFEKVGLIAFNTDEQTNKFYISKKHPPNYGNRRLFAWEKEINGDLKLSLQAKYKEATQNSDYQYALTPELSQTEVEHRVKVENKPVVGAPVSNVKQENKPILFNLREPIADFTGREVALENLHNILTKDRNMAVISPSLSAAVGSSNREDYHSIAGPSSAQTSQLSISGLGGIGKTQLALQYAKLYKQDYDNNVLWINAECLESLDSSFIKLASKLKQETKNQYGLDKPIDEIIDQIYEYFSDKKSLFIFDNAENFRGIEAYLPKALLGNKPTVLITSRFKNWRKIAKILSLDVFTEQETLTLFKKVLGDNHQQYHILTLNKMLQGLPLALNQAIAYIQFQRETDPGFSIEDYIELFKTKSKLLLAFNLEYNNDPYLKTVFTTWLVTLDKINKIPELGAMAIEVLDYTIYLDPENIKPEDFYALKDLHNLMGEYIYIDFVEYTNRLKQAMFLLKSYSLLNEGTEGHYVIHRLVQQVHRLNVENDPIKLREIVLNTQLLLLRQGNEEDDSHYLHFLLYMAEYENSKAFLTEDSIQLLFNKLANKEIKHWFYFIDLAYHKFSRRSYLVFLADSLAYCRKEGFIALVTEMLNYFEDQYEVANFSLVDIADMFSRIEYSRNYEITRFSTKPEKQALQKEAIHRIWESKNKIFGSYHNYNECVSSASSSTSRRKRNVCSEEELQAWLEKIDYQASKSHAEKVGQVAHYINSGLMTKDILGEICRGEWDEVAANFDFILGSQIIGEVSNQLLIQGIKSESEANLLIKELKLENPKVWSLLVNDEVAFIGKKLLLGKVLQMASTFVGSSTDLITFYNLKEAIDRFQKGDKTAVPEIVGTSVISMTGVTGFTLSAGAVLGFIERSTLRLINPYLAAFSALVWLGTSVYKTEAQVEAIQKYVHLSGKEHYIEFMRHFVGYQTSDYIEAKSKNEQLVLHALEFLKNNTDFRWTIAPLFSADNVLYENSTVLLDHKRTIALSTVTPDEPHEGHLAFLPGVPEDNQSNSQFAYLCNGAIGVEYFYNRTAEVVLISLGSGNDTAFGLPDFPNHFYVGSGTKYLTGGGGGNFFVMSSNATTGKLTGGKKSDALLLDFNLENSRYLLIDTHALLCSKQETLEDFVPEACAIEDSIELSQINQIYGRERQQDVIYLNPAVQFVDGYGGYDTEHADILFITKYSFQNPSIVLRNNTLVLFPIKNTIQSVDYKIPVKETGQAEIRTNFDETFQHRFFFDATLEDILNMSVQNNTSIVSVFVEDEEEVSTFSIKLYDPYFIIQGQSHIKNVTNFEKCSSYFFENVELKLVNNEQLFAQEILEDNKTLEQKRKRYSKLARNLEKTLTIQLFNKDLLAIGSRSQDYFSIDGSAVTHLVGNGGENTFLVIPKTPSLFPLQPITLHVDPNILSDVNEQIDSLDLSAVTGYVKKKCPRSAISYELSLEGMDLVLRLNSYMQSGTCTDTSESWELVTIRFKKGIYWYQKIDIVLEDKLSQRITTTDGETWSLMGPTLIFKEHKNIINLMPNDLAEASEISLLRNSGNYSFFRNESNLILSNMHTANPLTACSIIAHDYYQNPGMQRKWLSSKLSFLDKTFDFKDYKDQIEEAQHFSSFAKLLESEKDFKNKPKFHIPVLEEVPQELSKLRLKRQIPTSMKFRQAYESKGWVISYGSKKWELLSFNTGLMVLMTLAGGFYGWYKRRRQMVPILMGAALSSLPTGSAHKEKISAQETQLDFSSDFSIENNCLSAETPLGWVGVCLNKYSILFLKADQSVAPEIYFESYHFRDTDLLQIEKGVWETNPYNMTSNRLADEIYRLLPPHWQEQFMEKREQQQLWSIWKQRAVMTGISTVSDGLVLHTPLGDLFKTLGLAPDWSIREDRYLLSRCWWAVEQPLSPMNSLSNTLLSLSTLSAELALLHPTTHRAYRYLTSQGELAKGKFAVRFVADILQFGFYNLCHVAHVLECYFPVNESVKSISFGLRMANYFYCLTGDFSYWHLGLALFLLPQLPQLLDHLGIPATRGIQRFCNQLAICLLDQAVLQDLCVDEARQAQSERELSHADARVQQARQRLTTLVPANLSFFSANSKMSSSAVNDEAKERSKALQCLS